jgi:hypothetical protein
MTLSSRNVQENCSRTRVWTFNGTSAILYTSAEIIDCIAPWNGRVTGLVERCARMLTTSCVYEAYFLITTICRLPRLFRALLA